MIILGLIVAFMLGIAVGASKMGENDCPAVEMGYDCNGDRCDHRKTELYRAKLRMAEYAETREERRARGEI